MGFLAVEAFGRGRLSGRGVDSLLPCVSVSCDSGFLVLREGRAGK